MFNDANIIQKNREVKRFRDFFINFNNVNIVHEERLKKTALSWPSHALASHYPQSCCSHAGIRTQDNKIENFVN